jgi:hypothetical protein
MDVANHETTINDHSALKRFRNAKCTTCGKKFIMNDTIHTTTSKQGTKRYHQKCWDTKYY